MGFKIAVAKSHDEVVQEMIGDSAGGSVCEGGRVGVALSNTGSNSFYPSVEYLLGRWIL